MIGKIHRIIDLSKSHVVHVPAGHIILCETGKDLIFPIGVRL